MVEIKSSDLERFRVAGSGTFGTVYQISDDHAIKIYHDKINLGYSTYKNNPMLKEKKGRIKRILAKDKLLLYTDLVKDIVTLDGIYKGVLVPFYEGEDLSKKKDESFQFKINAAKELVRNGIELNNNYIYNRDYKLNNVIYGSNGLKIIDLDDIMTKYNIVKSKVLQNEATNALFETVICLLEDNIKRGYSKNIRGELGREYFFGSTQYEDIFNYLNYLECKKDIVCVYDIISLEEAEIIKRNRFKVIFIHLNDFYDDSSFMNIILEYRKMGIEIYDFISISEINNYIKQNNVLVRKLK